MNQKFSVLIIAVLMVLCLHGCGISKSQPPPEIGASNDCEQLFEMMDQLVAEHGIGDAGAARIANFPELRVDRLLASYANENLSGTVYAQWLGGLRQLDESARQIEWQNLPPEAMAQLQVAFGPNVETSLKVCGRVLGERNLISTVRRAKLLSAIDMPDAYSRWQRIFGLYFLTRWAIVDGVWRVQRELREPFVNPGRFVSGQWIRYAPPSADHLSGEEVAKILERSASNPLAIPEPSGEELSRLFSTFAPTWVVDSKDGNDRIGSVGFDAGGNSVIDTTTAVVYRLPSHTRFGGQVLLQLNYVIWFPARPATSRLDIYAGRFDGLIWRVTLRPDGRPLAYDSIHPCGCYYQIFPGEGFKVVQAGDGSEPILSPQPIGTTNSGERLAIRLSSGNHFILAVDSEKNMPENLFYHWQDYDTLRSLALPNGHYRSFFGDDGLVQGSERLERFLLWPMGIPNAGAMRQWGTHAIAFLGKRHFDDPRLLEKLLRPLRE